MTPLTRRSFLGLLAKLPLVAALGGLAVTQAAPEMASVEQAAGQATGDGFFLVPDEYLAEVRGVLVQSGALTDAPQAIAWPRVVVSQELLEDSAAFQGFIEQAINDTVARATGRFGR